MQENDLTPWQYSQHVKLHFKWKPPIVSRTEKVECAGVEIWKNGADNVWLIAGSFSGPMYAVIYSAFAAAADLSNETIPLIDQHNYAGEIAWAIRHGRW